MKKYRVHVIYIVLIIALQLINFNAVGYASHKSDWCDGFYEVSDMPHTSQIGVMDFMKILGRVFNG